MFADDTNLLFSNFDILVLFAAVNIALSKLSLNVTKIKCLFFQ